jgi:CRP-like cAMP-binding protein
MASIQQAALQLFVKRLAWRSVLTAEEKSAILAVNGQLDKIRARKDFVQVGEQVDHACLVASGLVGRFGQNRDGGRQITCLYVAGDMADLSSVVSPKAGWGLTALSAATVLRVPHDAIRRIAATHPDVAEAFWRDCVADGSMFSEWVLNVGRRDALSRLAHLFCEMGVRSERAGLGTKHAFPLPITQSDLADATGLTSVHVSRTLKQLRSKADVSVRGGTVTVPDWAKLTAIGEFDEAFLLLDGPAPRLVQPA